MNIDRAELAVHVVAEDHVVVELHERRPPSAGATGDDSRPAVETFAKSMTRDMDARTTAEPSPSRR